MKKNFKFYALIWAILLVTFNAVVFLVRPIIPGFDIVYGARFWVAWGFIIAAFLGNLACAYYAFRGDRANKVFYGLSLITISWSALICMLIAGVVLMLIPACPAWIAAIVCLLIFAFYAIAVVKALWAVSEVSRVEENVKVRTSFIKDLTGDAESLLARAKSDGVKEECKKVYEAVRYSDPMSHDALIHVEAQTAVKMDELSAAVDADDGERVKAIAAELLIFLGDRNRKCKALK